MRGGGGRNLADLGVGGYDIEIQNPCMNSAFLSGEERKAKNLPGDKMFKKNTCLRNS